MRILIAVAATLAVLATTALAKAPKLGASSFTVYEAYLSPAQEPGEESETKAKGATVAPPREQRSGRGWAELRFARELGSAVIDVELDGVKPDELVLLTVHCGAPGSVGPLLVDVGTRGSLAKLFAGGKLSLPLGNQDVTFQAKLPKGLKPADVTTCTTAGGAPIQVKNLAALERLARDGMLYVNVYTRTSAYYGEMRGQLYVADAPAAPSGNLVKKP